MNKNIYWAWAIKNSVCVICWTALAIVFNAWGIALFSLLFMSDLKTIPIKYYRVCDNCGTHSDYSDSPKEALEKAIKSGWIHCSETNTDYCPDCQQINQLF